MRLLIFITLLFTAAPVVAQAARDAQTNVATTAPNEASVRVERRSQEVERQAALDAVRREIDSSASARFENLVGLLAALIGLFALVATILLVVIAWRTPSQAIAAAVKAASDELDRHRDRMNERLADVERLVRQAESLVDRIRSHETTALSIIDGLRPGEAPESPEDRAIVGAAAAEASAKAPEERSTADYKSVVLRDLMRSDWEGLRRDAREMARLHIASPADLAFALFHEGLANGHLGQHRDEVNLYGDLVERFEEHPDDALQQMVARALLNRGIGFNRLGERDDAIRSYDKLLAKYAGKEGFERIVAAAAVNRGGRYMDAGRITDAIKDFDYVIGRLSGRDNPELQKECIRAKVDKISCLARLNRHYDVVADGEGMIEELRKKDDERSKEVLLTLLNSYAFSLLRLGRAEEAIAAYDEVVSAGADDPNSYGGRLYRFASFNLAAAHASLGRVRPAIHWLERWAAFVGSVDCALLKDEASFDPIRSRPTIQRFLVLHGCA